MTLYLPEPLYCTDNAAMIAWLGYEKYLACPESELFRPVSQFILPGVIRASKRHR